LHAIIFRILSAAALLSFRLTWNLGKALRRCAYSCRHTIAASAGGVLASRRFSKRRSAFHAHARMRFGAAAGRPFTRLPACSRYSAHCHHQAGSTCPGLNRPGAGADTNTLPSGRFATGGSTQVLRGAMSGSALPSAASTSAMTKAPANANSARGLLLEIIGSRLGASAVETTDLVACHERLAAATLTCSLDRAIACGRLLGDARGECRGPFS
jgi:hypothetical protein